jgi:hypothetical protein
MSDGQSWKEESEATKARSRNSGGNDDIERGYMSCPLCDAEIPISNEERDRGDDVYCSFCQVDYKIRKTQDDEIYLEGDY